MLFENKYGVELANLALNKQVFCLTSVILLEIHHVKRIVSAWLNETLVNITPSKNLNFV